MAAELLFGARQDNFDFCISTDENGLTAVYECYPDALKTIYRGKGCSVYTVDDESLQRGLTSWDEEFVCDKAVRVQSETAVPDLYEGLLGEEASGNIVLRRYEFNDAYRERIAARMVDRFICFDIDLKNCLKRDSRFSTYRKGIVEGLLAVSDGHLLQ